MFAEEYDDRGGVMEDISGSPLAISKEAEVLRCEILKRVELLAVDYWKLTNFFMKAAANNPDKVELVEKVRADIRELRVLLKNK